jgi:hypothetical protein
VFMNLPPKQNAVLISFISYICFIILDIFIVTNLVNGSLAAPWRFASDLA